MHLSVDVSLPCNALSNHSSAEVYCPNQYNRVGPQSRCQTVSLGQQDGRHYGSDEIPGRVEISLYLQEGYSCSTRTHSLPRCAVDPRTNQSNLK